MSTALIKTGFRKCGTYTLNRNTINKNRLTQYQVYSAAAPTTPSSTTLSVAISMPASINENQLDERSYEDSVTSANNEPSNNISELNQIESPSTPVNPLVAACIIT